MSLSAGTRLGPYEVVAPIGAGGMGEVYRARDISLNRDVAIKVLPEALSADPDRLRRFEQEARAAAALNHPNVLAVYAIGSYVSPDTGLAAPYIVSELLDGESLDARIAVGPLPLRRAAEYAAQIARGLAAARDKGIVHRDLKPANVFLTNHGGAKILDFGLAKLTEHEPLPGVGSIAATAPPATLPGVVIGTIGYMSPEQVRGLAADHRSDIFSFGAIFYEMLTGQRAFGGATSADAITSVLKEDPPELADGNRKIPPPLVRIVDRCLDKNPASRFQSAGDLAFAIESLSSPSGVGDVAAALDAAEPARHTVGLAWTVAAVCGAGFAVALSLAAWLYVGRQPVEQQVMRFSVLPPDGWTLSFNVQGQQGASAPLAVSPDGRRLAMVVKSSDGVDLLWVRAFDTLAPQMLAGTEGALSPFWAPDGRSLGFFAGGKLKRIDVAGGPPMTLADSRNNRGGAWSPDGLILFSPDPTGGLKKVAAIGGSVTDATTVGPDETGHWRPAFLPDGRHFLYGSVMKSNQAGSIYLASLDSSTRTAIITAPGAVNAIYSAGHVLFLREFTLMAQPLDLGRLATTGDAVPIVEQIQMQGSRITPYAMVSASSSGTLVFQSGAVTGALPRLVWYDRAGVQTPGPGDPADMGDVELSPDASQVAVNILDPAQRGRDIWILDVRSNSRTRLTFDPADDVSPVWSPDGKRIVFSSARQGHLDLYQKDSSGAGSEELLFGDEYPKTPRRFSPDGRLLLFVAQSRENDNDLWLLPMGGDRKPYPFLKTTSREDSGQISADGRWVAYVSNESGPSRIYVAPLGGQGGRWQIPADRANAPRWRRDGKELFFLDSASNMMAATIESQGGALKVGEVKTLFASTIPVGPRYMYDVTPDGQRFVAAVAGEVSKSSPPFTVVVNWAAGLRK